MQPEPVLKLPRKLGKQKLGMLHYHNLKKINIFFQIYTVKKQPFRYLVVMDFEATCDFELQPIVDMRKNSEIIEFPWVVLDMETLKIVHEERYYVQPDFMEGLTYVFLSTRSPSFLTDSLSFIIKILLFSIDRDIKRNGTPKLETRTDTRKGTYNSLTLYGLFL